MTSPAAPAPARARPAALVAEVFAPAPLVLGLLVLLAVTLRWKVSAHVAMAACWAVGLGALAAPWAVPLAAPVPVLVALSRVRTGDHTPAQTVVGALIGVLIGLAYTAAVASLR
ncbi:phosphatase PAP2 family protein [Kocuria turfanensis]|nr:phosphatase PAP2 family protein [Kocuria turfanensis]